MTRDGVAVELPGRGAVTLRELAVDFTGTLSCDGRLLPGVADALRAFSARLRITVLTADTFGSASRELACLPVEVRLVATGADKAAFVEALGPGGVVAIGNGRNDVAMFERAALSVAVVGPEGAAAELLAVADVVVRDALDAFGLLANPLRLKATLRD